jgi:dephospho-CoA kinase
LARIHTQMSLSEKVKRADFVIENGGDLHETERRVQEIFQVLLRGGPKKP